MREHADGVIPNNKHKCLWPWHYPNKTETGLTVRRGGGAMTMTTYAPSVFHVPDVQVVEECQDAW